MKIQITTEECDFLQKLLVQHSEGRTPHSFMGRILLNSDPSEAMPLLDRLAKNPSCLAIDGSQRELLLLLVAVGRHAHQAASRIFQRLQPQGMPLGAEVGDYVSVKETKSLVEVVHISGLTDWISGMTSEVIVCDAYWDSETMAADKPFSSWGVTELQWPAPVTSEKIIETYYPYGIAA